MRLNVLQFVEYICVVMSVFMFLRKIKVRNRMFTKKKKVEVLSFKNRFLHGYLQFYFETEYWSPYIPNIDSNIAQNIGYITFLTMRLLSILSALMDFSLNSSFWAIELEIYLRSLLLASIKKNYVKLLKNENEG